MSLEVANAKVEVAPPGGVAKAEDMDVSAFTEQGTDEAKAIKKKLRAFYAIYDEDRLEEGIDNIVDWTVRNGLDALNDKLKERYDTNLEDSILSKEEEKVEKDLDEEVELVDPVFALTDQEKELVEELKGFYTIYDSSTVLSKDYNSLVKYVRKRGIAKLNQKLLRKYGANLETFDTKKENNNSDSLPSILQSMPPPNPRHSKVVMSIGGKSGVNPLTTKEDDPQTLQIYLKLSKFYKLYAKDKLTKGIGHIVDWAVEHGEEALNKKLRKKYNKDLTVLEDPTASKKKEELENAEKELQTPPKPQAIDESLRYSQDGKLARKSGIDPATNKMDDSARLELSTRVTAFYSYFAPERLQKGIGDVVEWTLENGEEELNLELKLKYGYDLNTYEDKIKTDGEIDKEGEKVKAMVGEKISDMKERLVVFFQKHDPERAGRSLDILLKYIERKGLVAMNEKLFDKYGADLNTTPLELIPAAERKAKEKSMNRRSHKFILEPWVAGMLENFYCKYDPEYIENGGVETIYKWAERNGFDALNKTLKEKYNEDLVEFKKDADKLRDELIEFYLKVDKQKLVTGLEEVWSWGIKNGRDALNKNLGKKYMMNLDKTEAELELNDSDDELKKF